MNDIPELKFLDYGGLSYFWDKAKAYIKHFDDTKVDKTTKINNNGLTEDIILDGNNIYLDNLSGITIKNAIQTATNDGVTLFGNQKGEITIKNNSNVNGTVNFDMGGGKELNGTVYGLGRVAYVSDANSISVGGAGAYSRDIVANAINELDKAVKATDAKFVNYVPITRKINTKSLTSDITLTGEDITVGGVGVYNDKNVASAINQLHLDTDNAAKSGVVSLGGSKGSLNIDTGDVAGEIKFNISPTTNGTLRGTVNGWDNKAETNIALKSVTGKAEANKDNVTVTLTSIKANDDQTAPEFKLPAATQSTQGTVTLKQIADAVVSTYRVKGSKDTIIEVLSITNAKVGDVWNVIQEFELKGNKYLAGTNVVCIADTSTSTGNEGKWDPLGGTVDLTLYAKDDNVVHSIGGLKGAITIDGIGDASHNVIFTMSGTKLVANVDLSGYTPGKIERLPESEIDKLFTL